MKILMKSFRTLSIGGVALAVLLAGCADAGNDGSDAEPDPTEVEFSAVTNTAQAAADNAPTEASWVMSPINSFMLLATAVESWDGEEGTYTVGSITYTVEQSDNVWTWTFETTDEQGEPFTATYVIERTSSGWRYTYTFNRHVWLSGTISGNGLTGSFEFFDENGERVAVYEWDPAEDPHFLTFTATFYEDGSPSIIYSVSTTEDGQSGVWSLDANADGVTDDEGAWG